MTDAPSRRSSEYDELDGWIEVHAGGMRDIERALKTQIACMEPVMKLNWKLRHAKRTGEEPLSKLMTAVEHIPEARTLITELDSLGAAVHSQWQRGYPVLHGLVAIGIWAHVEACVTDVLGAWLDRNPSALSRKELRKLKVPAFVLSQTPDDRADTLAQALLQMIKNDRQGQTRYGGFELLELALAAAGLGPPPALADNLRDDLEELYAVRNVQAHRTGKVDAAFRERAPGRSSKAAGWSHVSAADVDLFMLAAKKYVGVLGTRVCREYPRAAGWIEIDWHPQDRTPDDPDAWARALADYCMRGYRARVTIEAAGETFRVKEASLEHRKAGVSRFEATEADRVEVSGLLRASGFPVA